LAISHEAYDECAVSFRQIQVRDPENYQSLLLSARLKLVKKQYAEAIQEYERLIARYQKLATSLLSIGPGLPFQGESAKALKYFDEAVSLDPNFEDALSQQAQLNVQKDEQMLPSHQYPIDQTPSATRHALSDPGWRLCPKRVISPMRLSPAASSKPSTPKIPGFLLSSAASCSSRKKDGSRKEFVKALNLSPDFLPAMEQLVSIDVLEKKFTSALERVQAEIENIPAFLNSTPFAPRFS